MYYIGIDLGTSSLKGMLMHPSKGVIKEVTEYYEVSYPQNGWTEQNPNDWIIAMTKVINTLSTGIESEIKGISFGGQMHGLVILDENDKIIRPCILWNDGRTTDETNYLNNIIGKEILNNETGNIAYAGFTAPKLLWLKKNEPENFNRIAKIMLPKDYLAYCLTGEFCSDYSDGCGTLFFDVKNKKWSEKMCKICNIELNQLPKLSESGKIIGKVKKDYNLPNANVSIGGGDNAIAAIGTKTIQNGDCNLSLGTSGTVLIVSDNFLQIKDNVLHSFCHSTGKWCLLGCILSAASANKWWIENILESNDYGKNVQDCEKILGENEVFFLPYLIGERSPINDANARGAFINLRINTTKEEMSLSVLEGVAFAFRSCIDIARDNGIIINKATLCGGGAKSILWRTILANVLNLDIMVPKIEQGPSFGAAILSMVANNEFSSLEEACTKFVKIDKIIKPNHELVEKYNKKYQVFSKIYPAIKNINK